jgi:hypothetical protein
MGYGEGICTTREKKYGKRQGQRVCPDCDQPAIIKGKQEYGGGWVCFKKKGGCGNKWPDGAEVIESQTVGEIDNPEIPDLWNTVDKMASKRSRIDAILAVTGASALFTQDLEDLPDHSPPVEPARSDVPAPVAKPDPGPPATEQQIDAIHEEAQAHDLDPIQYLNAIREGLGLEPKTEITEQAAAEAVPRILSKLPMAHVQPVLAAIRNTVPF